MLCRSVRRTIESRFPGYRHRGVTLIELMVTLTVVGVVLAFGVPNFRQTIEQNQLASQANQFMSALTVARSEAVKRGQVITVCKSGDGAACNAAAAGYEVGWIVFVDEDGNGARAGAEELVKRAYPLDTGYTLRGTAANAIDDFVSYRPSGRSSATGTGSFVLCKDNDTSKSRTIVIEFTGRTRVDKQDAGGCG